VTRVILVCVVAVFGAAGTASAQAAAQTKPVQTKPVQAPVQPPSPAAPGDATTTVAVASASVHARCDEASPLRITLGRGEVVVVQQVQDTWVNVRVPATNEEGCIRRSALAPVPALTRADEARRARQASTAPGAQKPRPRSSAANPRAVISINGGYQSASDTFSQEQTFSLYQETARYTSSYEVQSGPTIDAGGALRLWKGLGAGAAFTTFKDERDITIEGTLPHPFFFDRQRPISGTAPGTREETAVHVNAVYFLPVSPKFQVLVFGGPSFFTVKQSVVGPINYAEAFPYDTVTFTSATVREEKESKVGFNVGADVGFYFSKYIGVGGIVRFSRASIPFSLGERDAGGAEVGGGVRIRIP
jgi:hypothetical protein